MAWAYRASSYADGAGGTNSQASGATATVTLGAAASSGDLLVCGIHSGHSVANGDAAPTISISDSVNGAWASGNAVSTTYVEPGAGNVTEALWCFPNSAAGTPLITVTTTFTGGHSALCTGLMCAAYSGIATSSPIDTSATSTGTGSPATSTASGTETAANELVVGIYGDFGYGTSLTKDAAFTARGQHDSDSNFFEGLLEDKNSSGTTDTATVTTGGSTTWAMVEVVYKLPGGAAGLPPGLGPDTANMDVAMQSVQASMMR